MKRSHVLGRLSAGIALAVVSASTEAMAQDVTQPVVPPPPANVVSPAPPPPTDPSVRPIVGERLTYSRPNDLLFIGGVVVFAVAYVPSVMTAAALNTSFVDYLYIPVVGPWLDIAHRPQCGDGSLQLTCSTEWGRKAILVADGVFQGLGVTATVLGLVLPGRHTELITAKSDLPRKVHVSVTPSTVGADGYGVMALGDF